MTKYVSQKPSRCDAFHADPECSNLQKGVKEATQSELEWHELTPCERCYNE